MFQNISILLLISECLSIDHAYSLNLILQILLIIISFALEELYQLECKTMSLYKFA